MANLLSLALKINADASGVNLTPVERALKRLGDETDKVTGIFDKFTSGSAAAVQAQDSTRKSLEDLIAARRAGNVSATEFQNQFNAIAEAARTEAAALEQAARITEENRTATERFSIKQEELAAQLDAGRISTETYDRAIEKAAATLTDAERAAVGLSNAAREQAALFAEGEKIQKQYGDQTKNTQGQLDRLTELYKAGAIDIVAYNAASADLLGLDKEAEKSAKARTKAQEDATRSQQQLLSEANKIAEANLTAQEKFNRAVAKAQELRAKGVLAEEDYNREIDRQAKLFAKSTIEADKLQNKLEETAKNGLKLNELTGLFGLLPGPIGQVASKVSSLASSSEGLTRVFSGGLNSGLKGIVGSFTSLITPTTAVLAGLTGLAAGATAVARGLVDLEGRIENLTRLANQLGVSLEFVQTLEEAGRRADVSVQQLSGSFARLQNTLAGADDESKKAQAALSGLGVSVADFGALSEEQQFQLIGERLAAIEDPAKRSAAAIALFGRSGVQLLPFFNELPGAANDIERFGRAVTDIDQQRLADLGGSFDALGVATQGLGDSLLLPFVGLGDGAARAFAEITAGIAAVIDPIGRILEPLLTQLGRIIELVGTAIGNIGRQVGAVFEPFADAVQAVNQALTPLYEGLFDFLDSLSDATVGVAEWIASFNPLNLVTDNVGGLVSSIRDGLAPVLETIGRIVTVVTTAVQRFAEAAVSVFGEATATAQQAAVTFAEFTGLAGVIEGFASAVSSAFTGLWDGIRNIVSQIGGFIERVVSFAERWLGIRRDIEQPVEVAIEFPINNAVQLTDELAKQQEKVLEFGNAGTEVFLDYSRQLQDIADLVVEGEYTQEQANRAIATATSEYEKQVTILEEQAKKQKELAKEEESRAKKAQQEREAQIKQIDELLSKSTQTDTERQLQSVLDEIGRVEAELAAARSAGNAREADALASRIGELDQLQARLSDSIDQAAAGFGNGFDEAFQEASDSISGLIDRASELGEAGIAAGADLQAGIAAAQEQVRDGIFNRAAFEAEVARQEELFQKRISDIEKEAKAREEAAKKQFENDIAANERVQAFLKQQFGEQSDAAEQAAKRRIEAAENILAIENQIKLEQQSLAAAREQGDLASAKAGVERINALKDALTVEQQISEGREQQRISFEQQQKALAEASRVQEQQAQAFQKAREQQAVEAQKALEEQAKRNEERLARSRQLATASTEAAQGADIRTEAGARNFIQAIQGGFDPQLAVARQQLKVQREIAVGLQANLQALGFQTFRFPAAAGA